MIGVTGDTAVLNVMEVTKREVENVSKVLDVRGRAGKKPHVTNINVHVSKGKVG